MNRLFFITVILFFYGLTLNAEDKFSFRFAYGQESDSDLGEILSFQDPTAHKYSFHVLSLDAGYLLVKDTFDIPLDIYLKGGISQFNSEDLSKYSELAGMKDLTDNDIYEFTFYIKLYYNFDFWDNRVRLGFGEGGSYVNDYLAPEVIEENSDDPDDPKYSKYLNYLDISLDFDLGRLFGYKPLFNTYLGYTLKHRSGIFGLINGVSGGSNYNTISIERNF